MLANNKSLPVVEVISSNNLSDKQKARIKSKALLIFQMEAAEFDFLEDKSLIGGFLIKFGSKVCDLSIKEKINSL